MFQRVHKFRLENELSLCPLQICFSLVFYKESGQAGVWPIVGDWRTPGGRAHGNMYLCGIIGSFNTVVCDRACAELIVWLCRLLWLRSMCPCDMDPTLFPALETCSLTGAGVHLQWCFSAGGHICSWDGNFRAGDLGTGPGETSCWYPRITMPPDKVPIGKTGLVLCFLATAFPKDGT